MTRERVAAGFGVLGLILLGWGSYLGLFVAPPDRYMGDVQRIMYVHVPFAWLALVVFTLAFVYAVLFLVRRSWRWDAPTRRPSSWESSTPFCSASKAPSGVNRPGASTGLGTRA